jgi:hypothetical protein
LGGPKLEESILEPDDEGSSQLEEESYIQIETESILAPDVVNENQSPSF